MEETKVNRPYDAWGAWRIALLLLAFMLVNFFDKIVVGLLAVPLMTELKLTPVQFGMVGSSFFWLFAVGGIAGGFLCNRIATRWVLLAMALAWSLCQVPLFVPTSFAVFIAARVALGLTEGPAYPVAIHAAFKWFPPHKRIVPIAVFNAGAGLGLLIAGVTVPLVTARWGWRANFLLLCTLTIAWSLCWLAFGREGNVDAMATRTLLRPRVAYRHLLADRTLVATMAMQFASYWGVAFSFTWLPAYLQKGLGLEATASGRLYALIVAAAMPLAITASYGIQWLLVRGVPPRIARGWCTGACQMIAGAMFCCAAAPLLPLAVRAMFLIAGMALGSGSYAMCPAILGEVTPSAQRSAVLAIGNSVASLAGIFAPLITGHLVQAHAGSRGYELAFDVCGVLLIAGGLGGAAMVDPQRSLGRQLRGSGGAAGAPQTQST
jgi:MFS family permease